jgi:hypothetical protein
MVAPSRSIFGLLPLSSMFYTTPGPSLIQRVRLRAPAFKWLVSVPPLACISVSRVTYACF